MKIKNTFTFLITAIYISLATLTNAEAQTITSLSADTLTRSGRLKITGSSFGTTPGMVRIGGVTAPVSTWSDTSITAYVGETTGTGIVNVQVSATTGNSNSFPLNVTLRPTANGRVLWRFPVDAQYISGRPGIGADGTIYTLDVNGHLYALTPDGGLKWIFNRAPGPGRQSVDVGADGTIYFASGNVLYAVNPNGTQKWRVADEISYQAFESGPNVGPDGNVYAATLDGFAGGLGFVVISPAGQILSNTPGFGEWERGSKFFAREIFFSSNRAYHTLGKLNASHVYLSVHQIGGEFLFGRPALREANPAVAPDGTVYAVTNSSSVSNINLQAYDPNGNVLGVLFGANTNYLTSPDVGADGTIYIGRNLNFVNALNQNGSQKWQFTGSGILGDPTVNPQNSVLTIGGYDIGFPGYVHSIGANNGQLLWTVTLPEENGGFIRPSARPEFSRDGSTVYVGMSLATYSVSDEYSYLYAFQATDNQQVGNTSATLSGTISYAITTANQATKFVSGVNLSTTGTAQMSAISGNSGFYQLSGLTTGGNYTVTPSKIGNANGISPFDATMVLRYVAANGTGPNAFNANQRIAADTNGDGNITPFDATLILRYIAAGAQNANTGQVGNWKFDPVPRPYSPLNGSMSNENYTAILVGEVNGDWNP
ncbi:MAG TPA: PQQ-binding-like beta-propeller repeat protein [Pyrinomonadaceae bacterium]|jgi:outer membrane protein assembly factor BamB